MTFENEWIADIRKGTANLRKDRVKECSENVFLAYNIQSPVENLAVLKEETDIQAKDFQVIRYSELRTVDEFNAEKTSWGGYSKELGRRIALEERRKIFDQLDMAPPLEPPINLAKPDFGLVQKAAEELLARGYAPDVLCVPSPSMTAVYQCSWLEYDFTVDHLFIKIPEGPKLKLMPATKYVPLTKFVVFDSSQTRWTVKLDPETQERLTVAIGEPKDKAGSVMFLAETVAKFEVLDWGGVRSIPVTGLPDEQPG